MGLFPFGFWVNLWILIAENGARDFGMNNILRDDASG